MAIEPVVQHPPTAQSAEVLHAWPRSALPLHTEETQLSDVQSMDTLQGLPLLAPFGGTHRLAAQRSDTQSLFRWHTSPIVLRGSHIIADVPSAVGTVLQTPT
jgi:hypothetical protein